MNSPEQSQPQQPPEETISSEEAEAIKKEMFMTGGGVKVDQTMEQYRAEREQLWEAKKQREANENLNQISVEQAKKAEMVIADQIAANKVRSELGIPEKPAQSAVPERATQQKTEKVASRNSEMPEFERFKGLPNITQGLNALAKRLTGANPDWQTIQKIIYDMLTTRSEFTKLMEKNGNDLPKILEGLTKEREEYNELVKGTLPKWVDQSGEFKWESNPAWFGINTRPEAPRREAVNIKTYATIPTGQHNFAQHLPLLAQELRKLSLESDDIIQVKVPGNFATFISKNDSIVVHYKKAENGERIQEILSRWMGRYNVQEEPREMDRTKAAADSKGSSFTDLVAQNIAGWLKDNHGKYDSSMLSKLAVEYAIEQSQRPPEIKK